LRVVRQIETETPVLALSREGRTFLPMILPLKESMILPLFEYEFFSGSEYFFGGVFGFSSESEEIFFIEPDLLPLSRFFPSYQPER